MCPNCHDQADREEWGEKTLQDYKKKPWVLRRFGNSETTKQTSRIVLVIEKENEGEAFAENEKLFTLSALTGFLQISPYDLKIRRVEEGSIKLTIELPSEDAVSLLKHYDNVTPNLAQFLTPYRLVAVQAVPVYELVPNTSHFERPEMSEVRSIDGSGNNLEHPDWGKANEPLLRNTPPAYEGLNGPSGSDRPNPRLISDIVCSQDGSIPHHELSDFMWAWGQFLDHELDLTPTSGGEPFRIPPIPGKPAPIPFNRAVGASSTGTSIDNPRQQVNVISAFVDAANVYGTNTARAAVLRAFDGSGKLRVNEKDQDGSRALMPQNPGGLPNDPEPSEAHPSTEFFIAGDVRSNENVMLACMHTLFLREHNRLCDEILRERGGEEKKSGAGSYGGGGESGDEEIYQRARRIVSGKMQAITYNEFLPALLGKNALRPYSGYNQDVDPTVCNIFSTACYRLGHSMVSPLIQRLGKSPLKFEDTFFSGDGKKLTVPGLIKRDGIACYLAGAATQHMQQLDTKTIEALRSLLFHREADQMSMFMDLAALNIQRGRDHGLPDYNTCRQAYGLKRKKDFRDITSDPETQQRLKQAYDGNVDLIDPWVGGLAEDHVGDAVVGELIFHVLKDQFERTRDGDRFWYENDLALTEAELKEIRETTLAKVIAANTEVEGLPTTLDKSIFKVQKAANLRLKGTTTRRSTKKKAASKKTNKKTSKKKLSRAKKKSR